MNSNLSRAERARILTFQFGNFQGEAARGRPHDLDIDERTSNLPGERQVRSSSGYRCGEKIFGGRSLHNGQKTQQRLMQWLHAILEIFREKNDKYIFRFSVEKRQIYLPARKCPASLQAVLARLFGIFASSYAGI